MHSLNGRHLLVAAIAVICALALVDVAIKARLARASGEVEQLAAIVDTLDAIHGVGHSPDYAPPTLADFDVDLWGRLVETRRWRDILGKKWTFRIYVLDRAESALESARRYDPRRYPPLEDSCISGELTLGG